MMSNPLSYSLNLYMIHSEDFFFFLMSHTIYVVFFYLSLIYSLMRFHKHAQHQDNAIWLLQSTSRRLSGGVTPRRGLNPDLWPLTAEELHGHRHWSGKCSFPVIGERTRGTGDVDDQLIRRTADLHLLGRSCSGQFGVLPQYCMF